ncbi:MAG: peptidyl-dipeptidase Dcp, partial [Arenicella sp.]
MKKLLTSLLATSLAISACSPADPESSISEEVSNSVETQQLAEPETQKAQDLKFDASNPFFAESDLYLKIPAFDKINNEHYAPAFEAGMSLHLAEVDVIANNPEPATIENTLIALENGGAVLDRVASVFFALASADLNDEIDALRSEMAPKLSAHSDSIL